MTVHDFYPDRPNITGRTWWHCTACEVGWWGHREPCFHCETLDNVAAGPAQIRPVQGPPVERPHLSPRALRIVERTLHEHRPFWARRTA